MIIKKKLYRDRDNGMIAGVCAGLAYYLDINVIFVRISWFLLALFFGSGILIYLAAIFIMPEQPQDNNEIEVIETETEKKLHLSQENRIMAGVCSGLGKYYEIDENVVRFIFVILAFFYGTGILIYLLFALFLTDK